MRKKIVKFSFILILLYVSICSYMYFFQTDFIFKPTKIAAAFHFTFDQPYEEINIPVENATLNAGLFKTGSIAKGVIFFVHGNAENMTKLEEHADYYNSLGYDFFAYDFRSFGKSTGKNTTEQQFYKDAKIVYDFIKKRYNETKITVIGYSIGTATAAFLAAENHPRNLALIAPYYSLNKMTTHRYKIIPPFLLKFPFDTYKNVQKASCAIGLFHGTIDEVIPFENSVELAKCNEKATLYRFEGQLHDFFERNVAFRNKMNAFLEKN
jgi:pimeloyl-ACP methyl ester carboxylesterase